MGYACPVCDTPQRDGEHLAHHLAFTAMLHGDDHAEWLDERVADWSDREPAGLAAEVTPHADEAEYHEVFEDTVDRGRPNVEAGAHAGHEHAGGDRGPSAAGTGVVDESGATDPETTEALREAREMTREMLDGESERGGGREGNDGDAETRDADSEGGADRDGDGPSA